MSGTKNKFVHPKEVFCLFFWPLMGRNFFKQWPNVARKMRLSPQFGHLGNFLRGFTRLKYKKLIYLTQQLKSQSGTKSSCSETKLQTLTRMTRRYKFASQWPNWVFEWKFHPKRRLKTLIQQNWSVSIPLLKIKQLLWCSSKLQKEVICCIIFFMLITNMTKILPAWLNCLNCQLS